MVELSASELDLRLPTLLVMGLGVDSGPSIPRGQFEILKSATRVFFRTLKHPGAAELAVELSTFGIRVDNFDEEYGSEPDFDAVYTSIVAKLRGELFKATPSPAVETVCYLVPGSPLVAEETVRRLRSDPEIEVRIFPATSFIELSLLATGLDPVDGLSIIDGSELLARPYRLGSSPTLVGQVWSEELLGDLLAMLDDLGDDFRVDYLWHLGLPEEILVDARSGDFLRDHPPADHLTSLLISQQQSEAESVGELWQVIKELRLKCPWDKEQTHESLGRHLLEEAYETLEALDLISRSEELSESSMGHLEEELGDLMIQVLFHSNLAREEGFFSLGDLALLVREKLVYRHPHVFGDVEATRSEQVVENWEKLKLVEKGRSSVLEGIPNALPALSYAQKVIRKGLSVGVDLTADTDLLQSLLDTCRSLYSAGTIDEELLGDIIFLAAALGTSVKADVEALLRARTRKLVDQILIAEELRRQN